MQYAAIGCGGMGRRHLQGSAVLRRSSFANMELAAACDVKRDGDVALVYAPFEAGRLGRPVILEDMLSGRADVYQREIDERFGLR